MEPNYFVPNPSITLRFYRVSGDTVNHAQSQLFAWEAGARGSDLLDMAKSGTTSWKL